MSDTPKTDHIEDQLGSAARLSHPLIWRHARQLEREREEAIAALVYIAHSGLSARHMEDYAKEVLRKLR
jgi:hypothetical protein